MKTIEFYPGMSLDRAYQELRLNAPCRGEFNGKNLFSIDSLDDVYAKVTGMTKAEHDDFIRKEHEEYERKELEFKAKIPQLTEDYKKRARGIIPEEYLELWNKIVPIRLNDLYRGMELDCWLAFIEILNDTSKKELERFESCRSLFSKQGHSGMSGSLVLAGLRRFHPLGEMLVSYIKDPIDVHPIETNSLKQNTSL